MFNLPRSLLLAFFFITQVVVIILAPFGTSLLGTAVRASKGAKIMTTTWAMKKKASRKLYCRLNAQGYEQIDGKHYFGDLITAPVTNPNSVWTVLVLVAMNPE